MRVHVRLDKEDDQVGAFEDTASENYYVGIEGVNDADGGDGPDVEAAFLNLHGDGITAAATRKRVSKFTAGSFASALSPKPAQSLAICGTAQPTPSASVHRMPWGWLAIRASVDLLHVSRAFAGAGRMQRALVSCTFYVPHSRVSRGCIVCGVSHFNNSHLINNDTWFDSHPRIHHFLASFSRTRNRRETTRSTRHTYQVGWRVPSKSRCACRGH